MNVSLVETADTMIKKIKRDNAEPVAWALDSIETLPDEMELWDYLTEHGRPAGRLERESGGRPRPAPDSSWCLCVWTHNFGMAL